MNCLLDRNPKARVHVQFQELNEKYFENFLNLTQTHINVCNGKMKKLFYAHSNRKQNRRHQIQFALWKCGREIANKCVYCMNYALIDCSTFFAKFDQELLYWMRHRDRHRWECINSISTTDIIYVYRWCCTCFSFIIFLYYSHMHSLTHSISLRFLSF